MKKVFLLMMAAFLVFSLSGYSQAKTQKSTTTTTTQTTTKAADKSAPADKVVAGKKGPNGEAVYQGAQGGQYYLNKSGNKTYLKDVDSVVEGKKGPNGEIVYAGPKGGQYYLNKKGEKVYLTNDKK
jgi:hypothetical protein